MQRRNFVKLSGVAAALQAIPSIGFSQTGETFRIGSLTPITGAGSPYGPGMQQAVRIAVDEINGWTYIMSNFQHAGDWESPLHDKVKATLEPLINANYNARFGAAVGYLTAAPQQFKLA